jgi:aerobic carbon-monoxide dehydrogenase small subunit
VVRNRLAETRHIVLTVNGEERQADVEPRLLLVHFLRENLGLTGTHSGCDTTNCGACTVLMDGRAIKSCTVLAVQAEGRKILTVEGLSKKGKLHPVQEAFLAGHGLQCGFCTSGMLMSSYALLARNPNPTEDEIRTAISGNLCRCTGYVQIIESIQKASALMRKQRTREPTAKPRGSPLSR